MKQACITHRRFLTLSVAIGLLALSAPAHADHEVGLGLAWDARLPVGGLNDLVPGVGPAGGQARFEYYAIADRFTVGAAFQYNNFREIDEVVTVPIANGAATAQFARSAYFISLYPTARYYVLGRPTRIRPFLELGMGITGATSDVHAADLSRRLNTGAFLAQPSAGFLWVIEDSERGSASVGDAEPWMKGRTREHALAFSASAAWAFTTADVVTASNVSYVGLQLGLYWKR